MMEVVNWGGTGAPCFYRQRRILCGLQAVDMGVCFGWQDAEVGERPQRKTATTPLSGEKTSEGRRL